MWKQMNAKEKAIMELYKTNPDIAQSYWHCIRSFKEGCGYVTEDASSDRQTLQRLGARALSGRSACRRLEPLCEGCSDRISEEVR